MRYTQTMRKKIIAANWKMHAAPSGWDNDDSPYKAQDGIDVVVFPTSLDIRSCVEKFLVVGAQHGRPESSGAFTGDISMQLLASHGCTYALCGHSERRQNHGEDNAYIAAQVVSAIKAGLHALLCIGETKKEREEGRAKEVVKQQLESVVSQTESSVLESQFSIAYEPVWAIGKGVSATPADAQEMHAFIRELLPTDIKDSTRILYGGSVRPENAKDILSQPDVDGALVGAASLDPRAFKAIIDSLPHP
jgi:triosephosphate isomerase